MAKLTSILKTVGLLFVILSVALADFRQDALDAHNKYRAKHGAPKLALKHELNAYAQKYAELLANRDKIENSGGKYGENLYYSEGVGKTDSKVVKDATEGWYKELSHYDFNKPGFSHGTEHFTQLVWISSKYLGIGIGQRGSKYYVVASYDPPGNYYGEFPDNVLKVNSKALSGDKGDAGSRAPFVRSDLYELVIVILLFLGFM